MLEHLSGIVSSALHVSGGAVTGCERTGDAAIGLHHRIVDALAGGDGATAEAAMRELLAVPAGRPAAGAQDHVVPAPREH
jgi:DNA-binding FadR family transcriptional regulator